MMPMEPSSSTATLHRLKLLESARGFGFRLVVTNDVPWMLPGKQVLTRNCFSPLQGAFETVLFGCMALYMQGNKLDVQGLLSLNAVTVADAFGFRIGEGTRLRPLQMHITVGE